MVLVGVASDDIISLLLFMFVGVWLLLGDGGIISPGIEVELLVGDLFVLTLLLKNL